MYHADRRTEGRTDMTKLIVVFGNFVNASKKLNEETERRFRELFDALPTMEEADVEENWLWERFTERTLIMKLFDTRCTLLTLCISWSAYCTLSRITNYLTPGAHYQRYVPLGLRIVRYEEAQII